MRILAISGSLRAASSNTAVLKAAQRLAPADLEVALYDGLGHLPHFNPDLDQAEPPPPVQALRRQVGQCDGLLICCPEYAYGVPGAMKNALDWLVASVEFPGKPVALINVSPWASHAQAQLRETLNVMGARLVEPACIALPLPGSNLEVSAIVAHPELAAALRRALTAFGQAISTLPPAQGQLC
ncbi:MAG: NAD(P)H-dependent oxidoreductase [Verrucomicrobia bacterium]|nr:NAD(P)H-dependent oxidoreductase [Verrucomicrobiota bacterium]